MVEIATGPLLLRKSVMPLRLLPNHRDFPILKSHSRDSINEYSSIICCSIPINSSKLQTVPKQKDSMNTLISGMGVPCTGTLRASVLSDS